MALGTLDHLTNGTVRDAQFCLAMRTTQGNRHDLSLALTCLTLRSRYARLRDPICPILAKGVASSGSLCVASFCSLMTGVSFSFRQQFGISALDRFSVWPWWIRWIGIIVAKSFKFNNCPVFVWDHTDLEIARLHISIQKIGQVCINKTCNVSTEAWHYFDC